MEITTGDVLAMLAEIAELEVLDEGSPNAFRVRAYQNAIAGIEAAGVDVTELSEDELVRIKGVGRSIAQKIREYVETGKVAKLEELRAKYPPEFVALTRVPGLGPKTALKLREALGVQNLDDLKAAIDAHAVRELPGFGATSEEKLAKAIERLGLVGKERRTPIADALPLAERLVQRLAAVEGVDRVQYCGSLRRFRDTIGDIDIVVAATDPTPVMETVTDLPDTAEVIGTGETKTSIVTREGMQVDVRVVEPVQYGAALLYFTGSKAHNIALRQRAIEQGRLLNEYGLFVADTEEVVASETEEEIYMALGLDYIAPTLREDTGEVEAAAGHTLPELVQRRHIRGDLHFHTDRSGDGRASVEEMVAAAAEAGYRYVAITDHGENLAVNGASREEMLAHRDHIRRVQEQYPKLKLLWGCELNIGPDGSLDYDPDFRRELEWNVASVHSHFDLSQAEQTDRLLRAIADPAVDVIGHLTGRSIGRRPGIEIDVDAVLDALVEHDVALEVNGALQRLDAAPEVVRRAVAKGVTLTVSTDAHHPSELVRMDYGVLNAQRGWAAKADVLNTKPTRSFLAWLRRRRR